MKYFILIIISLLYNSSPSFADPSRKISATINSIIEFSNLKGGSSGKLSDKTYNKGTRLLKNALSQGGSISNSILKNKFGNTFASQWKQFIYSISLRLDGWQNFDVQKSKEGIRGMEKFRRYYESLRKRSQKSDSWFSWDLSKGEILPTFGCNKGAVVGWLLGC